MSLTRAESRHGTTKRDDQIEYLESQLQAYKARTSVLQQEYLSLLDTIYENKQRLEEELEQERNGRDLAASRLQTAKDRLRAVEAERDEYKEVVLQLIEKVEQSHNDFKHWPHSKLHLSSHVDSLLREKPVDDRKSDHVNAYNNGLVHFLKRELCLERQAHALTRARVNILSAQVARRDAALEGWVQHSTNVAAPPESFAYGKGKSKLPMQRDLDLSEIMALYNQKTANNRLLEQEIDSLFQHVEGARRNATKLARHTTSPHRASPTSSPQSIHASNDDLAYPLPSFSAVDPAQSEGQPDRSVRVQQGQLPARSHISPSPHRGRSVSTSHQPPSKPRSLTRSQSRHRPSTPRSSSLTAFPSANVVQDLSEQIRLLSIQIDGLRAERVALSRVIQSQREEATVTPDVFQRDSSFDSSDTDRDQSFDVDAGTDFEHGTTMVLEEHLNLDDVQVSRGAGVDAVRDKGSDGDATDGGERSMEIATPLISTLVTLPIPFEGDDAPRDVETREPGTEDGEIKMIRPRRGPSISPPMPP